MTEQLHDHPDPANSWKLLGEWIAFNVKTPEDEPVSSGVAQVLAIGAYIGSRFAVLFPEFALAIAEHGNARDDKVFDSINEAFNKDYAEWMKQNVEALIHNMGFRSPVKLVPHAPEGPQTDAKPDEPITDDDRTNILKGLDEWGKRSDA